MSNNLVPLKTVLASAPAKIKKKEPKAWTLVPDKSRRKRMSEQFLQSGERKKPVSRRLFFKLIKKRGFDAYPVYLDDIYDQYRKDDDLIEHFNSWFFKGHTATQYFNDCLKYIQNNKENNIFFIYGIIRGGKSRVARHVTLVGNRVAGVSARYHADPLNIDASRIYLSGKHFVTAPDNFDINMTPIPIADDYCTINFSQTKKAVLRMHAGDWLIQDELPDSRGEGSRNILKDIKNLLKIASGKRKLNFVFLNPTIVNMDNVKLYINIVATDKAKKRTLAILSAYTSTKPAVLKNRGVIVFNVDEPDKLTSDYESASDNVKKTFQDSAGSSLVEANLQLISDIVDSVWNMTPEQKEIVGDVIKIKEAFNAWLDLDPELAEAANSPRRQSIMALAYNKYKNLLSEQEGKGKSSTTTSAKVVYDHKVDDKGRFIWDQYDCLKKLFVDTKIVTERDLDIYWYFNHEGMKADPIKKRMNLKIQRSRISQIQGDVYELIGHEGEANKRKGAAYEVYLDSKLKAQYPGWKVFHDGDEGKPDFHISHADNKDIVVSAKVSDKLDRRIYYTPDDCGPEIDLARRLEEDGKNVDCKLNVYDIPTLTMHEQSIEFHKDKLPKNYIFDLPPLDESEAEEGEEPEDPETEDPAVQD